MANNPHLAEDSKATQFKPGQTGNPAGKPKGTIHLSTHIQNLINDETFAPENLDGKAFRGTPIKAIILTAIKKASDGDQKWAEWIAKHGYGEKLDITTNGESLSQPSPEHATAFADYLKNKTRH